MEGLVEKIKPYASGKGAFVTINGKEYMYFGVVGAKVDEHVTFTPGLPAKDGKPTLRMLKGTGIHAKEEIKDTREEYWRNKEKLERSEKPVITMLSCIHSACIANQNSDADKILVVARKFYAEAIGKKEVDSDGCP